MKIIFRLLPILILLLSGQVLADSNAAYWSYTLQPGNTLWQFADKHLVSAGYVPKLQALNNIKNPYRLQANTVIKVPFSWVRQQPGTATVRTMSGKTTLTLPNSKARTMALGEQVPTGATIKTGDNSQIILAFADGSTLVLGSNTQVTLTHMAYFPTTGASNNDINLEEGNVSSDVTKPKLMNNRYQLKTPSAITAVRGTELRVGVGEQQQTMTSVLSGQVDLTSQDHQQAIGAGFGAVADLNGKPGSPEKLLPPPELNQLNNMYHYNTPFLSWAPIDGAAGYHVNLYRKESVRTLLRDDVRTTPTYFPADLPDGDYQLVVRTRSRSGLEGKEQGHDFTIQANPQPPLVLQPQNGQAARKGAPVRFIFSEHRRPLLLQLSQDAGFASVAQQETIQPGTTFEHQIPEASGKWFWRVASTDAEGKPGPFSQAREINAAGSSFRFPSLKRYALGGPSYPVQDATYRLVVARDDKFQDILLHEDSNLPEWGLQREQPNPNQTYWVKIEVRNNQGYQASTPAEKVRWP